MQQGGTPLSTSWSSKRCPSLSSCSGNGTRRAPPSSQSTWVSKLTCSLRYLVALLLALIDAVARRIVASLTPHLHLALCNACGTTEVTKVDLVRFAAHDIAWNDRSLQLLPCLLLLVPIQFGLPTNSDPYSSAS